jgi:hypothetical protein
MLDKFGNMIGLSAWTPNDQGSFSKAEKPEGATVRIEGEKLEGGYELKTIIEAPVCEVESVEYLVLLVNGKYNHSAMGFIKNSNKKWALSSGDIYEETV